MDPQRKRPGFLSLPAMLHENAYVAFVFFSCCDIVLTWVILRKGGTEVNPVAAVVIRDWGLPGAVGFKFSLTLFVIVLCEVISRIRPRTGRALAIASVLVSASPVVWSGVLLTRHALDRDDPAPSARVGRVQPLAHPTQPNIVVILADDLGWGELSCQGQRRFATPSIDAVAAEGVRCVQGYSGSTVCAPSRCALLTGLHMGHAAVRDNVERPNPSKDEFGGQAPLAASAVTLGERLQRAGYETAFIGKWGLGTTGTEGDPLAQGFDRFFGYLCQRHAHNLYPTHLIRDGGREELAGNDPSTRAESRYAPDLMADEAAAFVGSRGPDAPPFLLVFASPLPHLALQAPPDEVARHALADDPPYEGGKGYLPCTQPRATYAAMVTRLDRHVGAIVDALKSRGLWERTIVVFTSDNGSTFGLGGYDPAWFDGTGGLRGHKTNLHEGGIRVPYLVRWPGVTSPGSTLSMPVTGWDLAPTLCAAAGVAMPVAETDGLDLRPWLAAAGAPIGPTPPDRALYWEFAGGGGQRAMRLGDWKAMQKSIRKDPDAPIELFDLAKDPAETTDVSAAHRELVSELRQRMITQRTQAEEPASDLPWGDPARIDPR
jgi:arylsulfatase A-like enzyme